MIGNHVVCLVMLAANLVFIQEIKKLKVLELCVQVVIRMTLIEDFILMSKVNLKKVLVTVLRIPLKTQKLIMKLMVHKNYLTVNQELIDMLKVVNHAVILMPIVKNVPMT